MVGEGPETYALTLLGAGVLGFYALLGSEAEVMPDKELTPERDAGA